MGMTMVSHQGCQLFNSVWSELVTFCGFSGSSNSGANKPVEESMFLSELTLLNLHVVNLLTVIPRNIIIIALLHTKPIMDSCIWFHLKRWSVFPFGNFQKRLCNSINYE